MAIVSNACLPCHFLNGSMSICTCIPGSDIYDVNDSITARLINETLLRCTSYLTTEVIISIVKDLPYTYFLYFEA